MSAPVIAYVVAPSRLNGCPNPRTRPLQTEVTVPKAPWVMSPVEYVTPRLPPALMSAAVGATAALLALPTG